ncbi:Rds1 protein [Atractiella rhizophila]|nr:Rds1 protein [Atractiella rhizophila]
MLFLSLLVVVSALPAQLEHVERNNYNSEQPFNGALDGPHMPSGGVGVKPSDPPPKYVPLSNFDFQSLNLALNQEYIELDLFHHGLARFSDADFDAHGINAEGRYLLQEMADQEVGHATALSNILGPKAAKRCNYTYPFNDVPGFLAFSSALTRWGEAGVYGFLPHLDSRPAAQILLQSITVEARQEMIFRQFEGLFPMPQWHNMGLPQSMAWTLLAPYLASCPKENPKIQWQNFPALKILNNPNPVVANAAVSRNTSDLTAPGRMVQLQWEKPGKNVSYGNGLYKTETNAGKPKFAAWISQLNVTYTPLTNFSSDGHSAFTKQPDARLFPNSILRGLGNDTAPFIVNATMFIAITDTNLHVTPYNTSLINPHVVAGPAVYFSG